MGHDLGLDLGDLRGDTVDGVSNPSVSCVGSGVASNAVLLALGSGLRGSAGLVFSGGVVVALGEGVRLAPFGGVVEPSSDESGSVEVVPCAGRIASVAALSAGDTAAGEEVFSGDSDLEFLSAGNADTVTHGLNGSECPAGSTGALVSDLLDGLAVGPGISGEELLGDVLEGLDILEWQFEVFWGLESTHQVLDLLVIHTIKVVVVASLPGGLEAVDVVDDRLEVDESSLLLGEGRDSKYAQYEDSRELHKIDY